MDINKIIEKKFNIAQKEVESKYKEIKKDLDEKCDNLLDNTYKQFEKTYDVNSKS